MDLWGLSMHFEVWGVMILLAAAATDWADGYFARRNAQVTTLGILLDPIADKLLISAAFISLVDMHLVPAWMEALPMMRVGDEWTLYVPPELGYGSEGAGPIPPDSVLVFRVRLLGMLSAD